jgi:putative ABC transport system ATP-binding protein
LIEVLDASRSFRSGPDEVIAVRKANLRVSTGEFACLYGASGSGKSTLLNLIAGLEVVDEGSIDVAGENVVALDETGRARLRLLTIGVVFQEHNLIEEFTAEENVALPLRATGVSFSDARGQAREQLSRVGIPDLAGRYPQQMSGGQRQRVGIARGLVGQRRVLLADEPTGALDSKNSHALFKLIRALCDEGMSALVATHDPLALDYAHVNYSMVDGSVTPYVEATE